MVPDGEAEDKNPRNPELALFSTVDIVNELKARFDVAVIILRRDNPRGDESDLAMYALKGRTINAVYEMNKYITGLIIADMQDEELIDPEDG